MNAPKTCQDVTRQILVYVTLNPIKADQVLNTKKVDLCKLPLKSGKNL